MSTRGSLATLSSAEIKLASLFTNSRREFHTFPAALRMETDVPLRCARGSVVGML